MHYRRGDYLKAKEMRVLDISYYKKAVSVIGSDILYIIFSDDLQWCKSNLNFLKNKVYIATNHDILDLYLMSYISKKIIANSTFSWWAAWLGENSDVYMPNPQNNWFSELYYKQHYYNNNMMDLKCKQWSIIE